LGYAGVKAARKMLVKLTPGVNFINIQRIAFTLVDPKSVKKIDNLTVFFTLLVYLCVKAARKMLVKSTPGVNFINIQRTAFTLVDPISVKKIHNLTVFVTLLGYACVKAARKMLVKSTPGCKLLIAINIQTIERKNHRRTHVRNTFK